MSLFRRRGKEVFFLSRGAGFWVVTAMAIIHCGHEGQVKSRGSPVICTLGLGSKRTGVCSVRALTHRVRSVKSLSIRSISRIVGSFIHTVGGILITNSGIGISKLKVFCAALAYPNIRRRGSYAIGGVSHIGLHFGISGSLHLTGSDATAAHKKRGGISFRLCARGGTISRKRKNNSNSRRPNGKRNNSNNKIAPSPSV